MMKMYFVRYSCRANQSWRGVYHLREFCQCSDINSLIHASHSQDDLVTVAFDGAGFAPQPSQLLDERSAAGLQRVASDASSVRNSSSTIGVYGLQGSLGLHTIVFESLPELPRAAAWLAYTIACSARA